MTHWSESEYRGFRFHLAEALSRGWPRDVAARHALAQNPGSARTEQEVLAKLGEAKLERASAIRVVQDNPKLPGSKCHERYERYKAAVTLEEMLRLGGTRADARFDAARGYMVHA